MMTDLYTKSLAYELTSYDDMADYTRYTNDTSDDLQDKLDTGFMADVTPDKDDDIIGVIYDWMTTDNFMMLINSLNDDETASHKIDINDDLELFKEFVTYYHIIKIDKKYYIDFD